MSATIASGRQQSPEREARRARVFGTAVIDLDVALADDRATAVTALLAACISDGRGLRPSEDEIWSWTLAERLQALLAVRLAAGDPAMDVRTRCGQCGEPMEIALDLRDFVSPPPAPRFDWTSLDGTALRLRLPQGRDLRDWQSAETPAPDQLASTLVEAVGGEPVSEPATLPGHWLPALEDAFENHDPLTALHLQAACPACAHTNNIDCDLEALLLAGFARVQARLIDEVARLATSFHWSEAEIVALPGWRREQYLRRLDAGAWM